MNWEKEENQIKEMIFINKQVKSNRMHIIILKFLLFRSFKQLRYIFYILIISFQGIFGR